MPLPSTPPCLCPHPPFPAKSAPRATSLHKKEKKNSSCQSISSQKFHKPPLDFFLIFFSFPAQVFRQVIVGNNVDGLIFPNNKNTMTGNLLFLDELHDWVAMTLCLAVNRPILPNSPIRSLSQELWNGFSSSSFSCVVNL